MRLRIVAVLASLAIVVARSAPAQVITSCSSPEVTLNASEPVSAPEGFVNASVAVYNTESGTEEDISLPEVKLGDNSFPATFTPDFWTIGILEKKKQDSVRAPEKFQLLWHNAATGEECLQPFSVLFVVPQRVLLNETGIESRYVNPVAPIQIDGRPLQFFNDTGDRTFVITIPFTYRGAEATNAYAVARRDRGGKPLNEIVCAVGIPCPTSEIQNLEALRLLLEQVSQANKVALSTDCTKEEGGQTKPFLKNGSCVAEYLFWHAVAQFTIPDLRSFAASNGDSPRIQEAVERASAGVVEHLLKTGGAFPDPRAFEAAARRQTAVTPLPSTPPSGPISSEAEDSGLKARFNSARIDLAKRALTAEISKQMGFPPPQERSPSRTALGRLVQTFLKRPGIEGPGFTCEVQEFLDKLDQARDNLAGKEGLCYACKRREIEAASKLLTSYSPNAAVPYSGLPATLLGGKECDDMKTRANGYALEMERSVDAETLSEHGFEITGCTSDGTNTMCSATATIPPYGAATFSRSVLAHHPGARIRFTAAFFGDTEIPGNANGYVTRSDATAADEKPKRAFTLQIGGDTSLSRDPDKAIGGQLQHAAATGSLAFQFVGPVEASATLQFKSGDLGGKSSQTTASQYQAKVYGPNRLVFQYGNITFAKPSSGIAINVSGEGLQVLAGSMSLGYVVQRESSDKEANKDNQDNSLFLLQLRNMRLRSGTGLFRTADLVALYGEEKKNASMEAPSQRPYHYWSAGGEARWGSRRFPSFGGSLAGYYSERNMEVSEPSMDPTVLKDGSGFVGFLRASWTDIPAPSWREKQEFRPAFSWSGFLGYGRGNKDTTFDKDEGYLGENAGYSNDMIFLSRVANSDAFSQKLGKGLSNKRYAGLQFTTWRFSPLALISKGIGAEKDIASRSTILTLHGYQFNHDVEGERDAGQEIDLAFNLEAPKNIQWVLSGAYYHTPPAIDRILGRKSDLWMASAKLSIKLDNL